MSPGPLQPSAPSSPKLPPMVPDPLLDGIEQSVNQAVARAMSGFESSIRDAVQDLTLEVRRQLSQSRSSAVDLENSMTGQETCWQPPPSVVLTRCSWNKGRQMTITR